MLVRQPLDHLIAGFSPDDARDLASVNREKIEWFHGPPGEAHTTARGWNAGWTIPYTHGHSGRFMVWLRDDRAEYEYIHGSCQDGPKAESVIQEAFLLDFLSQIRAYDPAAIETLALRFTRALVMTHPEDFVVEAEAAKYPDLRWALRFVIRWFEGDRHETIRRGAEKILREDPLLAKCQVICRRGDATKPNNGR